MASNHIYILIQQNVVFLHPIFSFNFFKVFKKDHTLTKVLAYRLLKSQVILQLLCSRIVTYINTLQPQWPTEKEKEKEKLSGMCMHSCTSTPYRAAVDNVDDYPQRLGACTCSHMLSPMEMSSMAPGITQHRCRRRCVPIKLCIDLSYTLIVRSAQKGSPRRSITKQEPPPRRAYPTAVDDVVVEYAEVCAHSAHRLCVMHV